MTNTVAPQAPLEDVMAAMDVVDTLRHEQGIAARELDTSGRRERLLDRLRDMYQAQGITVPDHILEEGIDALEQERFEYIPVEPSWRTKLAHVWVSRKRWGKPLGFFTLLSVIFFGIYVVVEVLPERRMRAELPSRLQMSLTQIKQTAKNSQVVDTAQQQVNSGQRALENDDYEQASYVLEQLESTSDRLDAQYDIRVVSRIDENSGVWRVPPDNPDVRNFYIIVEALDARNKAVSVNVLNQENNQRELVKVWGLRVSEQMFYKVAADKRDDGIIQNNKVGRKEIGLLEPTFTIETTGATITEW